MMRRRGEAGDVFRCFTGTGSGELRVARSEGGLTVRDGGRDLMRLEVRREDASLYLRLARRAEKGESETIRALMAAIEALFADDPLAARAELEGPAWIEMAGPLMRQGFAIPGESGLAVLPDMLWQMPGPWLAQERASAFPQHFVMTAGKRHPRRAPKPMGLVYSRYIPWLRQVFTLRTVDIDDDLDLFNRWMNDPRAAHLWDEPGDLDRHCAYLSAIAADPHILALLGCLEGRPFAYFEVYWAKENRLAPFYDVDDYDRGWHVVVGEEACRGRNYVGAWLPSLMHYLFLDDPRTQRIVGEPRADHADQIRNLERSGFASLKAFDFPHKRAMLVMLLRERFFGERLWMPRRPEGETPTAPA